MVSMANTILATALPQVSAELSGVQDYAAVVTAYLLPKALATPLGGRLVDAYTPRRVVGGFFLLYLVTTIACGLVSSMQELLAWRIFQGLGGGGLMASIYVTIDLLVPPRSQGKVQAKIATVLGAGAAAAPLVGGLIAEYLGWRWCFFANVPILLVCMASLRSLPSMGARGKATVDWKGSAALVAFSCPLMLALTWGGSDYSWQSPVILGLFAVSILAAPLFWWLEKKPEEPLFDPALAREPILRWSFLAGFCLGGAFLGSLLYLPLFVIVVKGATASGAGIAMLPFILGSIGGAIFGGARVEQTGRYQKTALLGCAAACLTSFLLYLQLEGPFGDLGFYVLQFLLAFAFGASQDMFSIAVQNSTPAHRLGMTGSALEFVRQLGSALGLALVGSIFLTSLNAEMPGVLQRWLGPIGVRVQVSQLEDPDQLNGIHTLILKAIVARAKSAAQGDETAYHALVATPILSESLHKRLDPNRHASLTHQELAELDKAADRTNQALLSALAGAVQEAQRQVYLLTALLCLLACFASWRLPDLELRAELREAD
jgi:MFS family permease